LKEIGYIEGKRMKNKQTNKLVSYERARHPKFLESNEMLEIGNFKWMQLDLFPAFLLRLLHGCCLVAAAAAAAAAAGPVLRL